MIVPRKDVHHSKAEKTPERLQRRTVVTGEYGNWCRGVQNCLMNRPIQVHTGEVLMTGARDLIQSRSHGQISNVMGELVHHCGVEDMILDHSISFERDLNRKLWASQNIVQFYLLIDSVDRTIQFVVRNKTVSVRVDIGQLEKI